MSLNSEMSPADIAALTRNNSGDGLFGGNNGAWFLIILFLFAFMGWGGGWNGNGGGSQGAANNYVLASDFATLQRQMSDGFGAMERKGDSISNGLCDGFYAQNSTMLNGFAGVQQSLNTQGYETRNAVQAAQVSQMQNTNALQAQIAQCCCDNKAGIADLKYTVGSTSAGMQSAFMQGLNDISRQTERGFCDVNYSNTSNTTAIIQNAHNDADRVLARLEQMESARQAERIARQAERIAQLQSENQGLRLAASQAEQNQYLIGQLKQPCPIPAYTVPNPYCCNNNHGCA